MKTSEQGLELIVGREGEELAAYRDTRGIWTIGVGHTSVAGPPVVTPTLRITKEQSREILARDLEKTERFVNVAVNVPLAQHEYDALVSIMLNVGPKFATSTAMRLLNRGDRRGAGSAIMMWKKPPEIISRRRGEQAQFRGTAFKARV